MRRENYFGSGKMGMLNFPISAARKEKPNHAKEQEPMVLGPGPAGPAFPGEKHCCCSILSLGKARGDPAGLPFHLFVSIPPLQRDILSQVPHA